MSSFICQQCFKFIIVHQTFHKINFEELSHEHPNVYEVLKPPQSAALSSTSQEDKLSDTGAFVNGLISEFYDMGDSENDTLTTKADLDAAKRNASNNLHLISKLFTIANEQLMSRTVGDGNDVYMDFQPPPTSFNRSSRSELTPSEVPTDATSLVAPNSPRTNGSALLPNPSALPVTTTTAIATTRPLPSTPFAPRPHGTTADSNHLTPTTASSSTTNSGANTRSTSLNNSNSFMSNHSASSSFIAPFYSQQKSAFDASCSVSASPVLPAPYYYALCNECASMVHEELSHVISDLDREIQLVEQSIKDWDGCSDFVIDDDAIARLLDEKKQLELQIIQNSTEAEDTARALRQLEDRETGNKKSESQFWHTYSGFRVSCIDFKVECASVDLLIDYYLERLSTSRISYTLNDCFHIWFAGHFGTVNGYRLGKLASVPVEFTESNAAWGLLAMLMHQICIMLNYQHKEIDLQPIGSYSVIQRRNNTSEVFPLHEDDGNFFNLFANHNYNKAIGLFFALVKDIIALVESRDKSFKTPYIIEDGKISGQSFQLPSIGTFWSNSEEEFTKSLKYLLTNIKILVAWLSDH